MTTLEQRVAALETQLKAIEERLHCSASQEATNEPLSKDAQKAFDDGGFHDAQTRLGSPSNTSRMSCLGLGRGCQPRFLADNESSFPVLQDAGGLNIFAQAAGADTPLA